MPARLHMRDVRKRFGATFALDGVDLAVNAGEVHALVGENGAGKSTLMKVLSGAHQPDSGTMELDGQPYRPRNPHYARLTGVCMIYQELSLAPHLSVVENIWLGMERSRVEMRRLAADALAQLGHADIPLHTRASTLSVAQQQIVEIARAIAIGCRVLVLDEPTSSLTQPDVKKLFALIRRLREQGHAIIYISHFLEEVKEISDSVTILRDGKTVGGGEAASLAVAEIVRLMVGRQVAELYPRSQRTRGEPVLRIADALTLHRGEVVGLAGLVGAGRTELLRHTFDTSGRWRNAVGFVSEDRKAEGLALSLSIADNATLTRLPAFVSPTGQARTTGRWLEMLRVKCRDARQSVGELSGGNQQKVALARLLHHNVDILLLDEPTRGIDVGSKAEIYRLIDELATQGKAVLIVSSYLPELLGICDRIAVMCRGRLGEARSVAETNEHQIILEATGAT